MKTSFRLLFALLFIAGVSSCDKDDDITQPTTPANPTPTDGYTSAADYLQSVGFSGSVLIRKGQEDVLRIGFGMADLGAGTPNEPSLRYRIGSMTKAFTAMGLVMLRRDGLIQNYDQPLSDFDDEFPHGDDITLRHLLTHYSGLPDYIDPIEDAVLNQGIYLDPEDIYDIIKESAGEDGLLYEPGTQWGYSNSNYLILSLLMEELTGMSYHDYLKLRVFDPLGLDQTMAGDDDMGGPGNALGYRNGEEPVGPYPMQLAYGAGDLISTLPNLETWGDALMGDAFLTAAEKADVFATPHDQDGLFTSGMGWFTISIDGTLIYNHGGNIDGFSSIIALVPEANGLIILLSNQEDWSPLNDVLETLVSNEF